MVAGVTSPAAAEAAELKALMTSAYDRAAQRFSDTADRYIYSRLAVPLIEALETAAGPVLDVAAGTGALGRSFTDVTAVDLSAGQLAYNPATRRVLADMESLPFRDTSFAAAACAFGINHLPHPVRAVAEMARVAPLVGVLTWLRPERPYAPKRIVNDILRRHLGEARSSAGLVLDQYAEAVGSVPAVRAVLEAAGLDASVREIAVTVPWPGTDAFFDYRLSIPSAPAAGDTAAVRRAAADEIAALAPAELNWTPRLVLGMGRRA